MKTESLSEKNWTFVILLYLCLLYLPYIIARNISGEEFMKGDDFFYRATIDSLLNDGDLVLDNNVPDLLIGQLAIGKEGFVLVHPILLPVVSLPFYALFSTPGLLLFNILDSMLLIILIFKLNHLFFNPVIAFISTILYATTTLFLDYIYNYSPDVFATVLLVGGLYLVFREKYYGGVFLLGLSIFAKLPNAALVAIILVYAGYRILTAGAENGNRARLPRSRFAVGMTAAAVFILSLIPFAYTNILQFGSPFVTGYQRMALPGPNGQVLAVDHVDKFNQPLLKGIYRVLFDIGNGVLLTNPVLILAFAGVFCLKGTQAQDKLYLILVLCLVQFLIIAKYDEWATSHFSNRFMMNFVALSSVFTSSFLNYAAHKYSLLGFRPSGQATDL